LQFETTLIGKTEEQVELARALRAEADSLIKLKDQLSKKAQEINAEVFDELELQKRLNALQTTTTTSKEKDIEASKNKVIVLNSELAEINKLSGVYQNMHDKNGAAIEKYITQQQTLKLLEKDRLQNIENITKAIEDQVARQQTLAGILQGINDKKVDMAFELKIKDFTPLEKQFAKIDEDARKAALEAARSFAAGFADLDMTAERTKELADGLDKIANSYKGIADAQIKSLEDSRSWSAGWKTAFDSYMDNATNAAKQAGDVFSAITSNMNSAIDKFVENGKFSFEDLAKSIIKDLIKIELKAQAVKLLGMLGGGGGIFSAIGSLFGFAEGGSPPINKPSIVGEKGPELFIPRSAGTIIPNGGGGGGVVNKTYITNNISAIDSKSVAQMFAENRKALLGTVQLAQKELPYGNR
jgi:lambda family phage tail tape measure protein